METSNPENDETKLNTLLQEWKATPALPPRFQEQVWRRIEQTQPALLERVTFASLFTTWLATRLPRPALATAYIMVLLVIGAGAGWRQARQETARVNDHLSARYAQAVDPYRAAP
jgi:hypothetical protein